MKELGVSIPPAHIGVDFGLFTMPAGVIRTKGCIDLAKNLPNFSGSCTIDRDKSARDMLEALRVGCGNIRKILGE